MAESDPLQLVEDIAEKVRELDALRRRLADHRPRLRMAADSLEVLLCRLGESAVAFRGVDVDEVVAMAELTELPMAPPWLAGLLAVGEERVPVVDLPARESGVRRVLHPSEFIVLAHAASGRLGVIVDGLQGLFTVPANAVHRPSSQLPFAAFVTAVVEVDGGSAALLSVEPLALAEPAVGAGR